MNTEEISALYEMTDEQLREFLITYDYKGVEQKKLSLAIMLQRAHDAGWHEAFEEYAQ